MTLDEILLAFSHCDSFPGPVHIGKVKSRILEERNGSIAGFKHLYSFQQSVQGTMERSAKENARSHPPYYFKVVSRGLYQLIPEGHARLNVLSANQDRQRAEEEKKRKAEAENKQKADQRSFLMSRTESPNLPDLVEFNGRRFVRDYPAAIKLKQIYGYSCQVCGITIATPDSRDKGECGYAEVHHIKPLGSSHGGPDYPGNMLVLCPDHHAGFDLSGMAMKPDSLEVYYLEPDGGVYKMGPLSLLKSSHKFDLDCLRYAWELYLRNLSENGLDISEAER